MECPITHQIYEDPVLVPCCGNSFERDALSAWLERHITCPLCRHSIPNFEPLDEPTNLALMHLIEEHLRSLRPVVRPDDTRPSAWIPAKHYTDRLHAIKTKK